MPLLILFFSLWLAGFSTNVFATDITVSLDRSPVSVDESFQIIFTASESPDDDPDFSPLEQDFTVQSQSQNSRMEWINGKSNRIIQWIVTVMANDSGNLIIPKIKFGSDSSPALKIVVSPSSANKTSQNDEDLFLEVSANTEKPFIQSQVLYTVKLYRRVDFAKANLSEPELPDAVIEKLADDANYTTQVSGVTYVVIERKYAIFPQKSGVTTIKPLVLTADTVARGRQNNSFFNSQITQRRIVKSNPITLNVQPIPATFTDSHWLTAENLELTQTWSGDIAQMKVGEPLTRTVKLVANGSTVGQLPELNSSKIDPQLKAYNDQPVLHEDKTLAGIVASREEKIAFIPAKAGNYTLPAIQISWFNTRTQKIELATLPEMSLTVAGAENAPQAQTPTVVEEKHIPPIPLSETGRQEMPVVENEQASLLWKSTAIFSTLGWLITLGFLFFKRKTASKKISEPIESPVEISLKVCVKQLKKACMTDDAQAAKTALLEWGKLQFNEISLGSIAPHCEARLRDEILQLNATLYAKEPQIWKGRELFKTFSENNAREKLAKSKTDALKPLYPI
ncbi:MAG: BatD family protein [Methylococcales bacterium]|nr:BatD family protein [Methylococcales bacterium]